MLGRATLAVLVGLLVAAAPAAAASQKVRTYASSEVRDLIDRSAVTVSGAAIIEVNHAEVVVTAKRTVKRLRRTGFTVQRMHPSGSSSGSAAAPPRSRRPTPRYHDYAEMGAESRAPRPPTPSIVSRFSIGTSYEGRRSGRSKVSDNVGDRRGRAGGPVHANQHAREHLTVEMALYLLRELTSKYATDARITNLVNSREIWIVFDVNPDGAEYDIATGTYRSWRKNRQPNAARRRRHRPQPQLGLPVGLLRRLSGTFSSETYRGAVAVLGARDQRVRDFVNSRVIGGVQQIKAHIDFHTYSRAGPVAVRLHDRRHGAGADRRRPGDALATLGQQMAATNGYTPEQASRPLHRRRHDQRLAVGRPQIFALHVRDVPAGRRTRASIRPTR